MARQRGVAGPDSHVGDTDFVFNLANHDPEFPGIRCHPVENTRRRTHRVGTIEFHSGCSPSHRQSFISAPDRQWLWAGWQGKRKGFEVLVRVVETGARHPHIFVDHRLTFALKLQSQNGLKNLKL